MASTETKQQPSVFIADTNNIIEDTKKLTRDLDLLTERFNETVNDIDKYLQHIHKIIRDNDRFKM